MTGNAEVKAAVIILVHNTPDLLLRCLRSFYESLRNKDWQIIVVDNGSEMDVHPLIEGEFCGVEVIRSEHNLGFAAGNNLGLRSAKGAFVVLVNSDVIASGETLEALVRSLQSEPQVGAMSPGLLTAQGEPQAFAFGGRMSPAYLVRRGARSVLGLRPLHDWSAKEPLDVEWVSAACLCVRRKVIEEIGGLDERFPLYFEDVDWCSRMRTAGWQVVYNPLLKVTHLGGASNPSGPADRKSLYYRSLLLFCEKHYGRGWGLLIRACLAVYRILAALRKSLRSSKGRIY
jgi:N-acetylglucosaminyl-diphospho-decaprenol L-rhamnosyltransferase